tara:strand:- start:197 stop:532 length:336 start_codon:yes stop_codon:yes gene_type:complete
MKNQQFDVITTGASLGATTTGNKIDVGSFRDIDMYMSCTAVSGTSPTLDAVVYSSADGTVWIAHTTFTQITAASTELKYLNKFGRYIRVVATIGGSSTPTVTFTLKAIGKS